MGFIKGFTLAKGSILPHSFSVNTKKIAFTLAEVLITLGIIGIVAALTMPTLIQKQQEKETVSRLKKFYSAVQQAYLFALNEHGTPDNWNLAGFNSTEGADNLLTKITPYMKNLKVCTQGVNCGLNYTFYNLGGDTAQASDSNIFSKAILNDGTIIYTQVLSPDCTGEYYGQNKVCAAIITDINGKKTPNTWGRDIYSFYIAKDKIFPAGIDTGNVTSIYTFDNTCLSKSGKGIFGAGCAAWVITNENMDYLKCDDLSWEGKKSCK